MTILGGSSPLTFRRVGHADLDLLADLQPEQSERFVEPVATILGVVRRGPAHNLVAMERDGAPIGFFVIHPDRRDRACWWLGWLIVDHRVQGSGCGRLAMAAIMARLRAVGCRRVRLLVSPENAPALRLYRRAGFQVVGTWAETGEWIMDYAALSSEPEPAILAGTANAYTLLQAMWLRLWRRGAPPAAKLSGEFHGPPHPGFRFA